MATNTNTVDVSVIQADMSLSFIYKGQSFVYYFDEFVSPTVPVPFSPCAGMPGGDYWIPLNNLSNLSVKVIKAGLPNPYANNNFCFKYSGQRLYFGYDYTDSNGEYTNYIFQSIDAYATLPLPTTNTLYYT